MEAEAAGRALRGRGVEHVFRPREKIECLGAVFEDRIESHEIDLTHGLKRRMLFQEIRDSITDAGSLRNAPLEAVKTCSPSGVAFVVTCPSAGDLIARAVI